jgi:hypothetical protein
VAPRQRHPYVECIGFTATNSGVLPSAGLTYSNAFVDYSFNQVNCPICGSIPAKINAALFADVNVFVWVSKRLVGLPGRTEQLTRTTAAN